MAIIMWHVACLQAATVWIDRAKDQRRWKLPGTYASIVVVDYSLSTYASIELVDSVDSFMSQIVLISCFLKWKGMLSVKSSFKFWIMPEPHDFMFSTCDSFVLFLINYIALQNITNM